MTKGSLEVICGSMFSGKTEELMRRLRRAEYAKHNVLTFKHEVDNRGSYTCILSHDGAKREAQCYVPGTGSTVSQMQKFVTPRTSVIGIDEVQFFPEEIVSLILEWVESGIRVIVSGLDLDFRGEPFGVMPELLAFADDIVKLRAICVVCGEDALHSQRIINGEPAKYDDPVIMVAAKEKYEARCRGCFKIDQSVRAQLSAAS